MMGHPVDSTVEIRTTEPCSRWLGESDHLRMYAPMLQKRELRTRGGARDECDE